MKLAHIYPIANQELYKEENYVMILAHLVKKGYYKPENFSEDQYIIMDNGLYEGEQVSTDLEAVIDIAENSGIPVKEIIIPDVVNDSNKTIGLFYQNLATIEKWQHKYKFMLVAQATNCEDLSTMLQFADMWDLNLSVGISKLCPFDRGCVDVLKQYAQWAKHPIHLLGIKKTFKELFPVFPFIRGCDTSQAAFIVKNNVKAPVIQYERDGVDIDLEKDTPSTAEVKKVKDEVNEILRGYGVLEQSQGVNS